LWAGDAVGEQAAGERTITCAKFQDAILQPEVLAKLAAQPSEIAHDPVDET
jgi:hypothetical protein